MARWVIQMTPENLAKCKDGRKTQTRRTNLRWLNVKKGDTIRFAPGRGKKVEPEVYEATEDARKERLQDISPEDALHEGAVPDNDNFSVGGTWHNGVAVFRELWDSIKTKPGERWADNPDVAVVSFRKVSP